MSSGAILVLMYSLPGQKDQFCHGHSNHMSGHRDIETDEEDEEERETTLRTLVKLVSDLKEIIENNQAELVVIKEEQRALRAQITELQGKIRTLHGQLSALSASLPPTRSWASVVAGTSSTQSATSLVV
jgi:hypothetical protein